MVVDRAKVVGDVKTVIDRMKVLVKKLVEVHRTVKEVLPTLKRPKKMIR